MTAVAVAIWWGDRLQWNHEIADRMLSEDDDYDEIAPGALADQYRSAVLRRTAQPPAGDSDQRSASTLRVGGGGDIQDAIRDHTLNQAPGHFGAGHQKVLAKPMTISALTFGSGTEALNYHLTTLVRLNQADP